MSTTTTTIDGGPVDADTDNDGILDAADNCPVIANNSQLDADGDDIGDVCDRRQAAAQAAASPCVSSR